MSREIKFRAWEKIQKEFLDMSDACYYLLPHGNLVQITCNERKPDTHIELDTVVQLYTGLKDCKGREIYEGDIVKNIVTLCVGEILWVKAYCRYGLKEAIFPNSTKPIVDCTMAQRYEVIGNIYENPELIGGKND